MIKAKRILCLLLALLLLLPLVVACKKNSDDPTAEETGSAAAGAQTAASSDVAEETTTEEELRYDENGYIMDNLDKWNIDLEGKEIYVLTGPWRVKYYYTDPTQLNTVMNTAVFNRQVTVAARLNCKVKYLTVDGDSYAKDNIVVQEVQRLLTENTLDAVAIYSLIASSLLMQGFYSDLNRSEILEFDKPWWNQAMAETCTIYDKLYFCTGDICYSTVEYAFSYIYNKDLASSLNMNTWLSETYDVEDIYQLVEDGRWTTDKMITLAKHVSSNEDGIKDSNDIYGYCAPVNAVDNFFQANGMVLTTKGSDGSLVVGSDVSSQKAGSLVEDLIDFLKHPGIQTEYAAYSKLADDGNYMKLFNDSHALFMHIEVGNIASDRSFDQGVVPAPMYDEEQDGYKTTLAFGYAMWGIVRGSTNEYEDVCAVMEAMASEGYRKTFPTYFNDILSGRQDNADDFNMVQLIHNSIVVDGGRVITSPFNDFVFGAFRHAVTEDRDYLAYYQPHMSEVSEQTVALNTLIRSYDTLFGEN